MVSTQPLIYVACLNNSVDVARLLLDYNVDCNYPIADNTTPLLQAVLSKSPELVKILLIKNADPNKANDRGITPLIMACNDKSNEAKEIALSLLAHKDIEVNIAMSNGFTPLILACSDNSEKVVEALLARGANANVMDEMGLTPLFVAYKKHSEHITALLLDAGANPNIINPKTKTSLLYNAYNDSDLKILDLLLNHKNKADYDFPNIDGTTILMSACEKGDLKTAMFLLKKGANINKANMNGDTPLTLASKSGNLELVKMLVDNKVDLELGKQGDLAMYFAIKNNYEKIGAFLEIEIKAKKILSKLEKNNQPPIKPQRLDKTTVSPHEEEKKKWIKSKANLISNQPRYSYFQSSNESKNKILKEINSIIETSINKIDLINSETRKEITDILSEELQKISINNLVSNKKVITNLITEGLKLNNQENNNSNEYKISQQDLRKIASNISTKYINKDQAQISNPTTNASTHKWQSYIKSNNNNTDKSNLLGRR